MPRELRRIRAVTAGAGDWGGDGAPWSLANPPAPVSAPHTELGSPIQALPIYVRENPELLTRGAVGLVLVTGADAARRFTLTLYVEWVLVSPDGTKVSEWRVPVGHVGVEIGNGEEFTTDPLELRDSRIAYHLVPIGGDLTDGSTVEIWASEL